MMGVVKGGGCRRILDDGILTSDLLALVGDELMEKDRLYPLSRFRRANARVDAVVSGDGGSPKMKNLMKAPIKITTDSWPSKKPSVNESEDCCCAG